MKNLIIYAHPFPKSFCHAILDTYTQTLKQHRREFVVRDLYGMKFDPILSPDELCDLQQCKITKEVRQEQLHVEKAGVVTFIYPIWNAGPPAILKGYWDRVLSKGFAYKYTLSGLKGLLDGRKAVLIRTQGASKEDYEKKMWPAMDTTSNSVLKKYGFDIAASVYFPKVPRATIWERNDYLEQVKKIAMKVNGLL